MDCCSSRTESVPGKKKHWHSLGAPAAEVRLAFTLPTGQSFRWRATGDAEFTGVIGSRVYKLRQETNDVIYTVIGRSRDATEAGDEAVLRDYFNLDTSLVPLAAQWVAADNRFRDVSPYIPGARVLRQDPLECVFEFLCSSNNHISRIHGMVERLCRDFGTPLVVESSCKEGGGEPGGDAVPGLSFYSFPTLEQLSEATEAHLRTEGFGYRAKFIVGSVALLRNKPGGGKSWLTALRDVPYPDAVQALCELPGVGPKVAACVALFALDKTCAIPVDTHVWALACRYYAPHLKGKTLSKQVMHLVEDAFIARFGDHAGWAHNTVFIAELASQQEHLPEHLRTARGTTASKRKRKTGAAAAVSASKENQSTEQSSNDVDQPAVVTAGTAVKVESADSHGASPLPPTPRQRSSRGRKRKQEQSTTEPGPSSSRSGGPDGKDTAASTTAIDQHAAESGQSSRDIASSGLPPSSAAPLEAGTVSAVMLEAEATVSRAAPLESGQGVAYKTESDPGAMPLRSEGTDGAPTTPQPTARRRKKRAA